MPGEGEMTSEPNKRVIKTRRRDPHGDVHNESPGTRKAQFISTKPCQTANGSVASPGRAVWRLMESYPDNRVLTDCIWASQDGVRSYIFTRSAWQQTYESFHESVQVPKAEFNVQKSEVIYQNSDPLEDLEGGQSFQQWAIHLAKHQSASNQIFSPNRHNPANICCVSCIMSLKQWHIQFWLFPIVHC